MSDEGESSGVDATAGGRSEETGSLGRNDPAATDVTGSADGDSDAEGGDGAVTDDAIEEISFLTRSPVRVRVLDSLRRLGTVEKRELRERVDGVRTTVTRNLNALVERGWIEDTPDGYEITDCGRMIADELIALTESTSLAVELRPALRWLDVEELGLDLRQFERADITTADPTNPYAPVEEQVALIRRATTVRAALPSVNRQILQACRRTARTDDGEVEIVLESAAVDRLRSTDRYAELFADVCRHCTVLEYDGTLPYYVGAAAEGVQLGTTDGDNLVRVLLRFDVDDDVLAWADDRFEGFEQRTHMVERRE